MTPLLSEMFLFWVRAACELRLATYGSKHPLQSLSDMSCCAYLHVQLKNYRLYMDILHINNWSTIGDIPFLVWSCIQANVGKLWFQKCIAVSFWYAICVYLHASLENCMSYMDVQHIEQLLYYQRPSFCGLVLHKRSNWRATAPDMHPSRLLPNTTLCAYRILQACT